MPAPDGRRRLALAAVASRQDRSTDMQEGPWLLHAASMSGQSCHIPDEGGVHVNPDKSQGETAATEQIRQTLAQATPVIASSREGDAVRYGRLAWKISKVAGFAFAGLGAAVFAPQA